MKKFDSKKLRIFTSPKKSLAVVLSICLIVPLVVAFANAERYPEDFYEDPGWEEEEARDYAWFAYNYTDYETLCTYLANETYDGAEKYSLWYGNGSDEIAVFMKEALATLPTPTSAYSAMHYSYHGFSKESFIPLMMAVAKTASGNFCEDAADEVGYGDYRIICFSNMGISNPISEEGLDTTEINYARVKYLYLLLIDYCYEYENLYGTPIDLNYCSLPLMTVVESLWNDGIITSNGWVPSSYTYNGITYTNAHDLYKIFTKIDFDDITSDSLKNKAKKSFSNGYNVFTCAGADFGKCASYAICPAKTQAATHNVIDTGSVYDFGFGDDEDGDDISSNDNEEKDDENEDQLGSGSDEDEKDNLGSNDKQSSDSE